MWTERILHVDMDSFFVEVERVRKPDLVGKPVAVGGTGPRGVIASASYEARQYGVRSAQPTATALRSCRHLIVLPPSHSTYSEASAEVFSIFRSFTPVVEGLSLDEAFLDVGGLTHHYNSPVDVGEAIRGRIRDHMGLPASVGVASTKFVAKLTSEAAKPDGLLHVPESESLEFLQALPAESLWGVGPATLAGLRRLGVETVGEIAELPVSAVLAAIGPTIGRHIHDLANGIDPRPVVSDSEAKSVSVEQTYDSDLSGLDVVETALLAHAQRLSSRLRRAGLKARTVSLKVRFDDFATVTRSHTHGAAIDGSRDLFHAGAALLRQVRLDRPVRLIGLGGSGLEDAAQPRQPGLGETEDWARVEDAVGRVRDRFGDDAVSPARLADTPNPNTTRDPS